MIKAVLISIRPKWCEKNASGEKTIEVRKTRPKLETPFKCYIYETQGWVEKDGIMEFRLGGRVIGEFTCDRIYGLAPLNHAPDDVEQQACLTREEIVRYLKGVGYGWHISGLRIYHQPLELTEFRRACPNDLYCESCAMYSNNNGICNNGALPLRHPPQSWCYVDEGRQWLNA